MDAPIFFFFLFFFQSEPNQHISIFSFFSHESEAMEEKRILICSKPKCFILSLSFFTQFCPEGVANVQL